MSDTFKVGDLTVRIERDSDAESPDRWGNEDLFLIATHREFYVKRDGAPGRLSEHKADYHILPLFAYIHSGVTLSLGRGGQFSDVWDSCQVGVVLVKKRQGFRNIRKAAQSLVDKWNMYLSGDVWGYVIEDADDTDGDDLDSCWGFYGYDFCKEEATRSAEYLVKDREKQAELIDSVMHL